MRDDYGHEYQRWGVCRRCGCDHGDLKATDPCPGELPDLQTQPMPVVRPPVLPNGPSRRRRRIEDLALAEYVILAERVRRPPSWSDNSATVLARLYLDAFQRGVDPDELDIAP
jgi:hypothetical protein